MSVNKVNMNPPRMFKDYILKPHDNTDMHITRHIEYWITEGSFYCIYRA